ncbi:MAG: nickel-dependent lactate racemase [Pyrinomonadaceae bacterium]|jgi:nickel-dependent lactate racemase|nr:nickel-dependent lactate racemase [Pyrinomonadaceae bacterium]
MNINLNYGKSFINFEFDENQFEVVGKIDDEKSLSDIEIGEKFDNPISSKTLEEIVQPSETVLIVVPDATRACASGQIVNLLVRRLIANGTMPFDIRIIFATGIHRQPTEAEKKEILTPFIYQRIKTLEHNARDLINLVKIGETNRGTPIELNRALLEHDHIITVGGMNWHYFAGFGGGRKLICPGLASSRTINETHKLAFDFEKKNRRDGVGIGLLEENVVHQEFIEIVEKINPSFSIHTITNNDDEVIDVICGDWKKSHLRACEIFAEKFSVQVAKKRDFVVVSCGGFPHDINLIQAHKALENAVQICNTGGTIYWLAECADGLGRNDFLKWFEAKTSEDLAKKLCESYQVNGQTAWTLLKKAEQFNIKIITTLSENNLSLMRLQKAHKIEFDSDKKGYILPFGAKFNVKV